MYVCMYVRHGPPTYLPTYIQEGKGNSPVVGDRVVIDWEGYTIGYYGRIFEAKGKVKVCMYVCMYGWMDGCMYVRTYVCINVRMYNPGRSFRCRGQRVPSFCPWQTTHDSCKYLPTYLPTYILDLHTYILTYLPTSRH